MSRVHDIIAKEVLRMEHGAFIFRLLLTIAAYVGITFWLNAIRQSAPIWFVWVLIAVQLFLFLTIFVVCSLRAKECGFKHTWLIFIPLILSRINDWEVVVIPALAVLMIIVSARNKNVAPKHRHLLPANFDSSETDDDNFNATGNA
jgi:hypothetical protein